MRTQKPPPTIAELLDRKRRGKLLPPPWSKEMRAFVRKANDRYWTWDDVRNHARPEDISADAAWYAVKRARLADQRHLRFQDTKGRSFWITLLGSRNEELHKIDIGMAGKLGGGPALLERSATERFVIRSQMDEAIASSQLEGATTTFKVAKNMLRTGRPPRDESEQMIFNNHRTIRWLRDYKCLELTKEMLFNIHTMIMENTLDPEKIGRTRRADEDIRVVDSRDGETLHVPPPADELNDRLDRMVAFANADSSGEGFIHPVVRAIVLHFWLAYDHPFVDGNGRTARALFYWSMLNRGYWLFEFLSISRIILNAHGQYGRAFLNTEADEADVTYFVTFHLRVINRARTQWHKYLARQRNLNRELIPLLDAQPGLNHRQQALIGHAMKQTGETYTIESHRRSHGVSRQTSRDDLGDLAARGLLIEHKVGRKLHYAVPEDFHRRLGVKRKPSEAKHQ